MNNEINLKKSILNLESLELKFKNKLIEYQSAFNTYLSALNNNSSQSSKLKIVPNTFYFNPPGISSSNVNSPEKCMALCSAKPNCSSANYNTKTGECNLQGGNNGFLSTDPTGTTTSIVMDNVINLKQLKTMNGDLINMNNTIYENIQKQNSEVNQHYQENSEENQKMIQRYQNLESEREMIKKMMGELETIKEDNKDQRVRISQSVSKYIFWGIIAFITMFVTVKVVLFPDTNTNLISIFLNTFIFILLVLWLMNLHSITVTFIILFLILIIIISKFT